MQGRPYAQARTRDEQELAPRVCAISQTARDRCRRWSHRLSVNSLYSSTLLSTLIVPPYCCTTMSYLMDRPRPVPSIVGLVLKKGWNNLSLISAYTPMPLSRTLIASASLNSRVVILSVGSKPGASSACCRLRAA
jgi:hypothetical protein